MTKLAILIGWSSLYHFANNAVIALYPLLAQEFRISKSLIGQVLGFYSISSFVSLPLTNWMLRKSSDLLVFEIGLALVFTSLVLVGLLPLVQDTALFLAISFLFRMLQGASDIVLNMSTIDMIQNVPEKDFYLNLLTGTLSIAAALGPLTVSLFSSSLGFSGLYFSLAGVVLFCLCICTMLHSYFANITMKKETLLEGYSQLNTAASTNDRLSLEVMDSQVIELNVQKILSIKKVSVALIFFASVASLWNYRDPILPLYLKSFGLSTSTISYFYLTQRLSNALFGMAPLLFVKRASPKSLIIAGSIVMALSQFLVGPSSILGLNHSFSLILLGQALFGASFNFAVAPMMSYLIQAIKDQYMFIENPEKLSFLYLAARSLGFWIGPFLGALLYESNGFSFTCDTFALLFVLIATVYSGLFDSILELLRPCRRKDNPVIEDFYRELNARGSTQSNSII